MTIVLALLIVTPIALFHVQDGRYYFGYIGINVWHNPTVIAAKPLALLTFAMTVHVFPQKVDVSVRSIYQSCLWLAVVVMIGALAKPSFLLCLVPASILFAFWRTGVSRQSVQWPLLALGLITPTLVILGGQSWIYSRYTNGAHATFSPFATMSAMSRHLGPKLILSILFPLACYAAWWHQAKNRPRLNLAWLAFVLGLLFSYLIAETKRTRHGNFLWTAQLALFVLFVESTLFAIQMVRQNQCNGGSSIKFRWQFGFCGSIFLLHFVYGIVYCVHLMSSRGENSWLTASWWYH